LHCTLTEGVALSVAGELLQDLNLNSLAVSSLTVSPPTSDTATLQHQQQQLSPVALVRSSQQQGQQHEAKRASTPAPSPSHKQRALQEQHEQLLNAASLSPPQTAAVLSPTSAMKLMYGSSSSGSECGSSDSEVSPAAVYDDDSGSGSSILHQEQQQPQPQRGAYAFPIDSMHVDTQLASPPHALRSEADSTSNSSADSSPTTTVAKKKSSLSPHAEEFVPSIGGVRVNSPPIGVSDAVAFALGNECDAEQQQQMQQQQQQQQQAEDSTDS
jgi:Ataxin-2 C-terminal region